MKKTGFIILAIVLALGALGVGFATAIPEWSQSLNLTGTATVASFNVSMTNAALTPADQPSGSSLTVFTVDPNMTKESYNLGNAGLIATINNAVPGVYTIPGVVIHNASSIPVTVTVVAIAGDGINTDMSSWVDVGSLGAGSQVLAAGTATSPTNVVITIPNEATQTTTYGFKIGVNVVQE